MPLPPIFRHLFHLAAYLPLEEDATRRLFMSMNDFLDLLQYRFYEMKPNVSKNYDDQKKNKNTANFF
jgi:hypothetical protein